MTREAGSGQKLHNTDSGLVPLGEAEVRSVTFHVDNVTRLYFTRSIEGYLRP